MAQASREGEALLPRLSPGVVGGALLGCLELPWLFWSWDAPSPFDALLTVLVCIGLGSLAGLLVALPLGPLVARLRGRENKVGTALVFLALGLLASAIDALAFRNLYATAHALLGLGTLTCLVLAVGIWLPAPGAKASSLMLLATALGLLLSIRGLQRHSVRAAVTRHANFSSHLAALAPVATPADEDYVCPWPRADALESSGSHAGESVLLVTLDAFRADVARDRLDELMPATAARLGDGSVFERAYAPAPRTTYSTYSMLTGRHPHRLGFVAATVDAQDRFRRLQADDPLMLDPRRWRLRHSYPLGDSTPTLAGALREQGYLTITVPTAIGLLPGAGITREFESAEVETYASLRRDQRRVSPAQQVADAAIAELRACEEGQPLFLWLHFLDPHHPYIGRGGVSEGAPESERYESEIADVDRALTRIYAALDASKCRVPKIMVLSGDHGEEFRDHGGTQHGTTLYEELVRVPLRIGILGLEGRRISGPVSLTDLTPTLLDLLGVATTGPMEGRTLVPALRGEPLEAWPVFLYNTSYTAQNDLQLGVVDENWKLIEDHKAGSTELFDLEQDPGERRNVADVQPEIVGQLRCLLRDLAGPQG
jgi:arylsulfatase A-like enzyme